MVWVRGLGSLGGLGAPSFTVDSVVSVTGQALKSPFTSFPSSRTSLSRSRTQERPRGPSVCTTTPVVPGRPLVTTPSAGSSFPLPPPFPSPLQGVHPLGGRPSLERVHNGNQGLDSSSHRETTGTTGMS